MCWCVRLRFRLTHAEKKHPHDKSNADILANATQSNKSFMVFRESSKNCKSDAAYRNENVNLTYFNIFVRVAQSCTASKSECAHFCSSSRSTRFFWKNIELLLTSVIFRRMFTWFWRNRGKFQILLSIIIVGCQMMSVYFPEISRNKYNIFKI